MKYIEIIKDREEIMAIIIRKNYSSDGVEFFTPEDFSQQLAYMHHKKGKKIQPHSHNAYLRQIHFTQEVLFIKRGKLKVDIFKNDKTYLSTHIIDEGDFILLAGGGHGFESLEELEMIEVKQGPYAGDNDKTLF